MRGGRHYRRYGCRPSTGEEHTFPVLMTDETENATLPAHWQPTPRCRDHPEGHVVRNGRHGIATEALRQGYRCYPMTGDRTISHDFTPALPRAYVEDDECVRCETPLGIHRGEQAVARRHRCAAYTIANAIIRLSNADTYGKVGVWVQETLDKARPGRQPRQPETPATKPKRLGKEQADNAWHLAADIVEAYSPVFWGPLEAKLRARAQAERARLDADRAAGRPLDRPMIWIADELTIKLHAKELFCVLIVVEATWKPGRREPVMELRVARVMPGRSVEDWLIVWDELAGKKDEPGEVWPDFLVSDMAHAILASARARFDGRTQWVPSLHHVASAIREHYNDDKATRRLDDEPMEAHLGLLARDSAALGSAAAWSEWWDKLDRLGQRKGAGFFDNIRSNYEAEWAAVIPALGQAWIPHSNAAVENFIRERFERLFQRRTAFANLERTNRLTDLVVCRVHGVLDSEAVVAKTLRDDALRHGGWAAALRDVIDPQPSPRPRLAYGSLRDHTLAGRMAYYRGLA